MATSCPLALTSFFCYILLLEPICSSGAFLDFSYDSTQVKIPSSSVITEYGVMVTEKQHAYIFLKPFESSAKHLSGSFVSEVLVPSRHLNVSDVVVTATDRQLSALRRTLEIVHASLGMAGSARSVKVSPELSLSSLRTIAKNRAKRKQWGKVMEFVRRSGSFVQVEMEAEVNGEVAVGAAIRDAIAGVAALSGTDAGVVVHLKSRAAPTDADVAKLVGDIGREKRFLGLLVDVSAARRELGEARATRHDGFSPVTNPATMPVTNPVTVPATNPETNPMSPGVVTVPSTNPDTGTGFSSSPNLPPLYPEPTTPVTMPDPTTTTPSPVTAPVPTMNPVTAPTTPMGSVTNPTAPVTNPAAPVTNPATTPTTFPGTSPVSSQGTAYPYPPQGGGGVGMPSTTPVYQPPATMPGGTVQPAAPTGAGQTWCVAKTGLTDLALQNGIDYACGMGGADCSAIQAMGSCYNPNSLQAHASYAFNSYFQRNPSPTSCDFGGAGMLVNVNPSSGTCMYQTSSGVSSGYTPGAATGGGYSPGATGTGPAGTTTGGVSGTGSTVLNANNPGGNSMYGDTDNPTSLSAGSAPLSCGWALCLIWMVAFAFVKEKM